MGDLDGLIISARATVDHLALVSVMLNVCVCYPVISAQQ